MLCAISASINLYLSQINTHWHAILNKQGKHGKILFRVTFQEPNQRIKIHCMGIIGMTRAILVCVLFKTCDHTVPSIGCAIEHKALTMCSLMLSLIQNIRANWCQPLSHIPAVNSSCHVCSHSEI